MSTRLNTRLQWTWVVLFAIAFAWVEGAVVVYLRDIFFDGQFRFPLVVQWEGQRHVINPLVRIEFFREIATLVMLLAAGLMAGKGLLEKFSFFMLAFGVWDIFYYVWLYVMTAWPPSLLTWDLLFYVPLPWVGPVITPILIALAMAAFASVLVACSADGFAFRWRWFDTLFEIGCSLLLIVSFCWDWKNILQVPGDVTHSGLPNPFAWWLFLPAFAAAVGYAAMRLIQTRYKR
jgi:hypothetical protein